MGTMDVALGGRGPLGARTSEGNGRMPVADLDGCDVGELYRNLAKPLELVVRCDIQAPASVIEEACQFAWARLVHHGGRVRSDTAFGWLVRTAVHEALKLIRRASREVSLDAEIEAGLDAPDLRPGPVDISERRERLRTLSSLSGRQQRLLWLYGLGLTYVEIAARDGCTPRTVERQLQRARDTLRAVDGGPPSPAPEP